MEPLFERNRPIIRSPIKESAKPAERKKRKPSAYNLAWFWWKCLNEAGAPVPEGWSLNIGLKPAKKLLEEYPYEMVLEAVGWASSNRGPAGGKRAYSLWWLLKFFPDWLKKVKRYR